jgi:hypothetical protein
MTSPAKPVRHRQAPSSGTSRRIALWRITRPSAGGSSKASATTWSRSVRLSQETSTFQRPVRFRRRAYRRGLGMRGPYCCLSGRRYRHAGQHCRRRSRSNPRASQQNCRHRSHLSNGRVICGPVAIRGAGAVRGGWSSAFSAALKPGLRPSLLPSQRKPLQRVHGCVFYVLAIESGAADPCL